MIYSNNYYYALYGSYVLFVLAGLYTLCMCCCWSNISLGASIMEAASEFISETLRIMFLPPIAYTVSMMYMVFWLYTAMHLYSIG